MATQRVDVLAHALPAGDGTWTICIQPPSHSFPGEQVLRGLVATTGEIALNRFVALVEEARRLRHYAHATPQQRDLVAWAQAVEHDERSR